MPDYPNGKWPSSALAFIPGGTKMGGHAVIRKDLLPSIIALQAYALADGGFVLRPTSAADGYRSYEAQVRTFLSRYSRQLVGEGPYSDVRYWNGVRYVRVAGASAAVPGTSTHGDAEAVDWADIGPKGGYRWTWMMENAPTFGWVNPLWARDTNPRNGSIEPWHWENLRVVPVSEYKHLLTGHGIVVPGTEAPEPILPEEIDEDEMKIIQRGTANGSKSLIIGNAVIAGLSPWTETDVIKVVFPDVEEEIVTTAAYDGMLTLLPWLNGKTLAEQIAAALPADKAEITVETIAEGVRLALREGI